MAERVNSKVAAANGPERVDILTILTGRLYALEEGTEKDDAIPEVKMYVSTALACLGDTETREASLEVIRALPTRTLAEVNYILQIAKDAQDQDARDDIEKACGAALSHASTQVPEIRAALEQAKQSSADAIRNTAKRLLKPNRSN